MDINNYEIVLTDIAQEELEEVYEYIFKNLYNELSADSLMDKMEKAIFSLEQNPYKYPEVHIRQRNEVYRKLVVDNYIVLYEVDEEYKQVVVYRVIYGKRKRICCLSIT